MKIINKNIWLLLAVSMVWGCKNQDVTFDDFDYTAVYFPLQSPVRTLILGEDRIDNSLDKELKFNVGVSIGGLYTNNEDWDVAVDYDYDLALGLNTVNGDTIIALPGDYILGTTPGLPGSTTIPSGEFNGLIEFQLRPEFLDDSLAFTGQYVIPLRITNTSADSILTGSPIVADPDKRIAADWEVSAPPKDYTLFGIKFINEFDGSYLHKGKNVEKDSDGNIVNTTVYSANFLTQNEVWNLATRGKNKVITNGLAQNLGDGFGMTLTFNDNTIAVSPAASSTISVNGSGQYIPAAQSDQVWGGESRNTIVLNYSYEDGGNTFEVTDTLVIRDRDVVFEELEVEVVE